MTVPYCSICGVEVPDLTVNHHVCVQKGVDADGKPLYVPSTRDEAAKALVDAQKDAIAANVATNTAAAEQAEAVQP